MIIGIYKITSPTNRIYIGQSIDIFKRWNGTYFRNKADGIRLLRSLKKYGHENHKFEIQEICNIIQLNEKERYWQDYYNVIGKFGLNCKLTSTDDKSGYYREESKEKMRKSKQTLEYKLRMSSMVSKPVLQFGKDGKFIKEWNSVTEVMKILNIADVGICCNNKVKLVGGFLWRFKSNFQNIPNYIDPPIYKNKSKSNILKVLQFDKDGSFIKEFKSIKEATNELNLKRSDIGSVCIGNQKTAHGYIWKYKDYTYKPKLSEETRIKLRNTKLGTIYSEETKQKISNSKLGIKYGLTKGIGKKFTEEHINNMKKSKLKCINNS